MNIKDSTDLITAANEYSKLFEDEEERCNIRNAFFHGHKCALERNDDYVVVPKSELLKLEEARKQLYKLLERQLNDVYFHAAFTSITGQIWDVANTRDWKIKI